MNSEKNDVTDDNDVTGNFLHVIRERRKEKFGKMVYDSDEPIKKNFDADGYFQELIMRNRIRAKIKAAREKRNSIIDREDEDEEEDEKQNTATLFKKISEDHDLAEKNRTSSSSQEGSKDSGKGTPSGDTLRSYNDGSTVQNTPSKTMKRVRMKLRTAKTFSAIDEFKIRYKKEREKQMELLETIRQLRGKSRTDFYKDLSSSEDELSDNDDKDTKPSNINNEKKTEIMKHEPVQREKVLSPITNQLLTPERIPSPVADNQSIPSSPQPPPSQTTASTPDNDESTRTVEVEVHPDNEESTRTVEVEVHPEIETNVNPESSKSDDEYANETTDKPETSSNDPASPVLRTKVKKTGKKFGIVIKTSGCRIDSRWPKGHKFFTKPINEDELQNSKTSCYEQEQFQNLSPLPAIKPFNKRSKRLSTRRKRIQVEHDLWREKLIKIAYDKEFEYMKRRSLTLFPYKQEGLAQIELDHQKSKFHKNCYKSTSKSLYNPVSPKPRRRKKLQNKPITDEQNEREHYNITEAPTRTKSGNTSNDQGYDSDENVTDHTEPHSLSAKGENDISNVTSSNVPNQRKQKLQMWK